MTQITMDEWVASQKFHGETYEEKHDRHRLTSQYARVFTLMRDGQWRTLSEIQEEVGGSEAAISARLRDFRKPENGGHAVDRRRRGEPSAGVWEYRLSLQPASGSWPGL